MYSKLINGFRGAEKLNQTKNTDSVVDSSVVKVFQRKNIIVNNRLMNDHCVYICGMLAKRTMIFIYILLIFYLMVMPKE